MKLIDLTGQKFGRLIVIERAENKRGRVAWNCKCKCGNTCVVTTKELRNHDTISCGCFHTEVVKNTMSTHKKYRTRLYRVWKQMKTRCYNFKYPQFKDWGGRGIKICDEWLNNFQAFYDWSMANGYDENAPRGQCTIDRIDNDKWYSPDNCRWVDMKTQNKNKRIFKKTS